MWLYLANIQTVDRKAYRIVLNSAQINKKETTVVQMDPSCN